MHLCKGNWKEGVAIPEISFEASEENLEGEKKALFLEFIRKMLRWVPEERQTAAELLKDSWLTSGDDGGEGDVWTNTATMTPNLIDSTAFLELPLSRAQLKPLSDLSAYYEQCQKIPSLIIQPTYPVQGVSLLPNSSPYNP